MSPVTALEADAIRRYRTVPYKNSTKKIRLYPEAMLSRSEVFLRKEFGLFQILFSKNL